MPVSATRSADLDDVRTISKRGLASGLRLRLQGPGGLYNFGNAIALAAGLTAQILAAFAAGGGLGAAVREYFFGSPGATLFSLAILIFILAGEVYHRAWSAAGGPDRLLIRVGDLLAALAGTVLAAALMYFGDVALAVVAGVLLAGGRLGSALLPAQMEGGRTDRLLRLSTLVSRLPSLATLGLDIAAGGGWLPVVLFGCFLIWARADLLFLRPARPVTPPC